MIIEQLYDALIEGGTSPEKAREAARAVAGYDNRLNEVERDLTVLKWMVGVSITLTLGFGFGNLWVSYSILSRLP